MRARRWLHLACVLLLATVAVGAFPYGAQAPEEVLARYVALARRDPYFALPGTDPLVLTRAIEGFEVTASLAIAPSIATPAELYPFSFLKALAIAEGTRRTLIDAPSPERALAYHDALAHVFATYEEDTERLIAYLRNSKGPERFGFLSGETSRTYIANILTESLLRVRAYARTEETRFACAQGSLSRCRISLTRVLPERPSNEEPTTTALPAYGTLFRDALRAYDAGLYQGESTTVSLSRSVCYPTEKPMFYDVASTTSRLSGAAMAWMRPLNDLYFYDLAGTDRPSLLELRDAGMTYEYQPLNAYLCPDFGTEMGTALSILYAHHSLRERPLQSENEHLTALMQEQATFIGEDFPTEALFERFAEEAGYILSRYPTEHLEASLGRDGLLHLEELALLSKTRSGYFERTIGYFDDFQMGSAVFQAPPRGHVGEFLVARGGLSSLLLLFNKTAAFPAEVSLIQTKTTDVSTMPEVLSYRRELQSEVPLSQVMELLRKNALIKQQVYGPRMEALIVRRAQ